ncbi:autotransporter domain-containing protein [Erythrobacter sp. Alg231-14]|uniref:autotransporter domain-containing protein n=1 Tax=Erythrobacter sp. Alg231-14 TaxID=1922225 RepID=UPI000D54C83B
MTNSSSIKIRAIGGASALALSVGLSVGMAAPVFAQSAPAPLIAAPTPTAPAVPANVEECAIVSGVVTCAPGTDADGFLDFTDAPLGLDIQDGSVVQGPVVITGAVTGGVDGSIQTAGDFDGGLLAGAGSNVTNDGFIQTTGQFSVAVEVGAGSALTNNGTIYTSGDNFSDAISLSEGATFTNSGLVQTDGAESFGVFGAGDSITVTNTSTGTIVTSGEASFGIAVLNDANITNDGLIQTFGDFGIGIDTQETGTVTNSGNIVTGGASAIGVGMRNDATFTNTASGSIATSGDEARGVSVLLRGTIVNDGSITTSGDTAVGVRALADSTITNNGTVATTGANASDALEVRDNSVVNNNGIIQTGGENSLGVFGLGDGVTVNNAAGGEISTTGDGGFAVALENDGVVQNDGVIQTTGEAGIGVDFLDGGTLVNTGSITTTGDLAIGVSMLDDATFTNTGSVATSGGNLGVVIVGANSTVENDGSISSVGDDAIAIIGGDATTVTLTANSVVSTQGDNAGGVVILGAGNVSNAGSITTQGDGAQAVTITGDATVNNTGTITADLARIFDIGGVAIVTNSASGTLTSGGDDAIRFSGDGSSLTNEGTISSTGGFGTTLNADGVNDVVLVNSGTISAGEDAFIAVAAGDNFNATNSGTISSFFVGVAAGDGLSLDNAATGSITSQDGPAIAAGNLAVITNAGTISSATANAIESSNTADAISLDNSGTIESTAGGAGVLFDNGSITNAAGGSISGDIAGISSPGTGALTVVNFGSIEGLMGDAVLLGDGNGEFQQWTGATVTGNVDLEGGDDTFILEGSNSSVAGMILGGAGADTAIIAGTLDADNFGGFETFQFGSDLGGTLNDARISGDRTVDGDVAIAGEVVLGLGVDSLTSTGSITLEDTGTVTIETPLDVALVGQTVLVLQDGTGFTDNGGTINIIDDDLLVDYVPVVGSLSVQVNAVNQLITSADSNLVTFGSAITTALNAGTLSQDNFDLINGLPDVDAFEALAIDALPTLNNGAAREIFETSTAASDALNRHLAGEGTGIWGQFILRGADQDALSSTSGAYESDQTIFTVGGDFMVGDMGRVGLIASYADIENDNLNGAVVGGQTEIESIKVGGYFAANFAERGFLNGEIAYLSGEIEDQRGGSLGAINSAYDFDGFAYSATVGFDLLPNDSFALTPSLGVNGATIGFDDAVEAGGFALNVARDDANFVELRGGLALSGELSPQFSGFVQGTVVQDLGDDARTFNLTSAQLGAVTVISPDREQTRFELGAGASMDVTETFSIEVGYLGDFADGYDAHSGRVTARVAF